MVFISPVNCNKEVITYKTCELYKPNSIGREHSFKFDDKRSHMQLSLLILLIVLCLVFNFKLIEVKCLKNSHTLIIYSRIDFAFYVTILIEKTVNHV